MELAILKTEKEYESALDEVDILFDKTVRKESEEGRYLEKLLLLIKQYEDEHYKIPYNRKDGTDV